MSDLVAILASYCVIRGKTGHARRPIGYRFWKYVSPEPNSGCWLWDGSTDSHGYGQLRLAAAPGESRLVYATHISLAIHGRPVPPGLCACHKCDNPYCVNPEHLFVGTHAENMQDCVAKGRNSKPPLCVKGSRVLKTRCYRGHELAGGNLYLRRDGFRVCKECMRITKRNRRGRETIENGASRRGPTG